MPERITDRIVAFRLPFTMEPKPGVRIERFVQAFFPKLAEFQRPPRHMKWRETNLAAVLPGACELKQVIAPAPMLVRAPMVALPIYEKWPIFTPGPR